MERLTITIHPDKSDLEPLGVEDALRQVVDLLRLHRGAARGVAYPEAPFRWVLESASTNSPFTVTARAESLYKERDSDPFVRQLTREWVRGLGDLMQHGIAPLWADPDALVIAADVFRRNQNGIGITEIRPEEGPSIVIDRARAEKGLQLVRTVDVLADEPNTGEAESWGLLRARIFHAGTYGRRKTPAIKVSSPQYGTVWCVLTPALASQFGNELKLKETWENRLLSIEGRFIYKAGGKLDRIIAVDVHPVEDAPDIDIDSIRDRAFTGGLDPVEYLRELYEGELG